MLAGARTLTASSESSGLLEGWSACSHTTARAHFWLCLWQLSRSLLVCKVCRSKLQIHDRRSRQVTWQFIRSIWCIVSGLHPRSVQQAHQSVGCFLLRPLRPNMCALTVWCASVAKADLHHKTLRVSWVFSLSDVCRSVRLDHRKLDQTAPYQTPLSSCRRLTVQDRRFAVRLFRIASNMELRLHGLGPRTGWS